MPNNRWTISILTIPSREDYVRGLLDSLRASGATRSAAVSIVYNWDTPESPRAVEQRLRRLCRGVELEVAFNTTQPTIAAGRQQQLNACRTPLICFLDDDVTVQGDLIGTLDAALGRHPLGLAGVPSVVGATGEPFKPRASTPFVDRDGIRFMTVQGMAVGGYRRLFIDVGGFNPRRCFWGEWTELNLRMWRSGFPTGYAMEGAFLRHWHDAPDSPTRNRSGRELDVLWGLMCTALEYDAVDITESTSSFWRLVADRYLAYAFGAAVSSESLLSAFLQLAPRLTREWGGIAETRERSSRHPFQFAPFAELSADDVAVVTRYASPRVAAYRAELPTVQASPWDLRKALPRAWRRLRTA